MEKLIRLIHSQGAENWKQRCDEAFEEIYSSQDGRYPEKAKKVTNLRAPAFSPESGVPFAALIHPSNPDSGAYGGMSFVIFPINDGPCLVSLGIGTQGLSPDEEVLGRPGHARKVRAICNMINTEFGNGQMLAWSKQDPTRTDIDIPLNIKQIFEGYSSVFDRYGKVLYGIFRPIDNPEAPIKILKAFLDLMFEERVIYPRASATQDYKRIQSEYFTYLFPKVDSQEVVDLIKRRKYIILEGPPGTGKTRMAMKIMAEHYHNNGATIQFHPNTTYETFIGGLSPEKNTSELGFHFTPKKGDLMDAIVKAMNSFGKDYLLHIDEINRADLSKVLGEAIYLFEPKSEIQRKVKLAHDFVVPISNSLHLPENLHILGTMNTADRSIAIVDIAVCRRFAYLKLWPQMEVVNANSCALMQEAFKKTVSIFVEYANDEAFNLVPGHSYFLENDTEKAKKSLKVELAPLLEEYLAQGYVASFADSIRGHLQWIESL